MITELTMKEIEEKKLFEEAKERYENCHSNRWKNAWWNVLCNIWKSTKKFATKYFLDVVNKVVRYVSEIKDIINYTYFIRLYDANNETVYNKVGKAQDPLRRWEQILKDDYCKRNGVVGYEIRYVWEIRNQWAEGLESFIRAMLIKTHGASYVPNDRFACDISDEELLPVVNMYLN